MFREKRLERKVPKNVFVCGWKVVRGKEGTREVIERVSKCGGEGMRKGEGESL